MARKFEYKKYIVYISFITVLVAFSIILRDKGFLSYANMMNILRQTTMISVAAVGMTFAISAGLIEMCIRDRPFHPAGRRYALLPGDEDRSPGPVLRGADGRMGADPLGHEGLLPDRRADEGDPGSQRSEKRCDRQGHDHGRSHEDVADDGSGAGRVQNKLIEEIP